MILVLAATETEMMAHILLGFLFIILAFVLLVKRDISYIVMYHCPMWCSVLSFQLSSILNAFVTVVGYLFSLIRIFFSTAR